MTRLAKALTLSASTVAPGPSTPTHEAQLNEVILRLHHGQLARVLYAGVTSDLERRVLEHKKGLLPGFTSKYHITWLVYYEVHERAIYAIEREKRIKTWRRDKKVALVEGMNPAWDDLAAGWVRR